MKRKQGISLIVLVITIIVMIILAASVVITLSNSGIINKANDAVTKTNIKEVEQLASLTWAEEFMSGKRGDDLKTAVLEKLEDYIDEYNIEVTDKGVNVNDKNNSTSTNWKLQREYDNEGLISKVIVTNGVESYEVGSTINYMSSGVGPTNYTGGWKLLGLDDEGRFLIMSTESITGSNIDLYGLEGFNNGVSILNTTAGQYKDGIIGVAARSIKISDIDTVTGYNPSVFTGDKYISMAVALSAKAGNVMTQEEILAKLGYSTIEEMGVTNINLDVTYSWDGTEYPKYTYVIDDVTYTGHLQSSHKATGFSYYDKVNKTFVTVPYTTTPGDIATIKNDTHVYHGLLEYAETCKAYKMLFLSSDETSGSRYWLADNFTSYFLGTVVFGIRGVFDGMVYGDNQWSTKGINTWVAATPARAVVTLANGISLVESTTNPGTYDIVE